MRVIGNFNKESNFTLLIDDDFDCQDPKILTTKASMVIVEPHILIPTTRIVSAFPCQRKAFIGHQFRGNSSDIRYPLVLGNVIHGLFQDILAQMNFRNEVIQQLIKGAIKD